MGWAMLGLIFAIALPVADEAPSSAAPVPSITQPYWIRKPNGNDISRVYPREAERDNRGGRATIQCSVGEDGKLSSCTIMAEAPSENGFGPAAIRLAPLFKMRPMARDGVPVKGGVVRIPVLFVPPARATLPITITDPSRIEGQVALSCRLTAEQKIDNCLVTHEQPSTSGLGDLALTLAPNLKLNSKSSFRLQVIFTFKKG